MESLPKRWYREPWPWYLIAGPATVVVASAITAWLAISSADGLVTDDYYKEGMVVDRTLARSRLAEALGLEVRARFTSEGVSMGLYAKSGETPFIWPSIINLTVSHPTRAGLDQNVALVRAGDTYVGTFRLPASGHWLILVEDDARTWRMMGNVMLPAQGEVIIGGAVRTEKDS